MMIDAKLTTLLEIIIKYHEVLYGGGVFLQFGRFPGAFLQKLVNQIGFRGHFQKTKFKK